MKMSLRILGGQYENLELKIGVKLEIKKVWG